MKNYELVKQQFLVFCFVKYVNSKIAYWQMNYLIAHMY